MTFQYACGVDPSGGGAAQFAWAFAHRDGERIVVDLVRGMGGRQRLDVKAAAATCAEDCRRYGIVTVMGDRYGGDWPAAEFRLLGIAYQAVPKDKAALYLEMLPLFTAGLIEIPDDRELVRQAKLLERSSAGRGRDRVDHPRGGHDDLINAVALAVHVVVSVAPFDPREILHGDRRLGFEGVARYAGGGITLPVRMARTPAEAHRMHRAKARGPSWMRRF